MVDEETIAKLAEALRAALEADAPVNARLTMYADALRQHHVVFADAVDRLVERLQRTNAGGEAPMVGDLMPPFLLPDHEGRLVSLGGLNAHGPVAVVFHRGHWCPYCQINSQALASGYDRVTALGATIVSITPEIQRFTAMHRANAGARYRILSDIDNGYALSLNLAIWVGDELKRIMSDFGRNLDDYQHNASWFLPIPAAFVVDRQGVIRARFVDPDYRRRMDVDALVTALAAAR